MHEKPCVRNILHFLFIYKKYNLKAMLCLRLAEIWLKKLLVYTNAHRNGHMHRQLSSHLWASWYIYKVLGEMCGDVIWGQTAILPAVETFLSPYRARSFGHILEPSTKHPLQMNGGKLHSAFSAEQELLSLNSFWMHPCEY